MCGRFVIAKELNHVVQLFEIDEVIGGQPSQSFNVAPTHQVSMFVDLSEPSPERQLHSARWGLVPSWAKAIEGNSPLINARIESVLEKPSFRDSVQSKRCAIPASGYFEWQTTDGSKTPFYVHPTEPGMLAFAGIYSWWRNPALEKTDPDRWVLSVSLLTKDSASKLAHIHDRNPVLLSMDALDNWLDADFEVSDESLGWIAGESDSVVSELEFYAVDRAVGSVRNNYPDLIKPSA
jgi:putative SOS response-associated peptidase YedK